MSSSEVKAEPGERAAIVAMVGVPIAILGLWWMPRPAEPTELPALVLPRAETHAALAADAALAARAPSTDAERARREVYLAQGRAEVRADETLADATLRAHELVATLDAVIAESGDDAVAAVRLADVLRLEAALAGEGTPTERAGEAGRFDRSLERWGAIENGRRVAPPLVVRAMAIARWNALFARPLTEGLGPLHLRAYHGWLALHGEPGWTELREDALARYAAAGGPRALETQAVLLLEADEPQAAEALFTRAYALVGSLRLRNLALGALARGAGDDEPR